MWNYSGATSVIANPPARFREAPLRSDSRSKQSRSVRGWGSSSWPGRARRQAGERAAGWGVAQSVIVPVGRVSRTARGVRLCMSIGPTVEPFRARGVLVHPGTARRCCRKCGSAPNTCVQAADRGLGSCVVGRASHGCWQCLGRIVDRVLPTRADASHICSRLVGNAERDPMSERSQAGSRAWSAANGSTVRRSARAPADGTHRRPARLRIVRERYRLKSRRRAR